LRQPSTRPWERSAHRRWVYRARHFPIVRDDQQRVNQSEKRRYGSWRHRLHEMSRLFEHARLL